MDAIAKGERYWLDDSDEAILKQTNRESPSTTGNSTHKPWMP